MKLKIKQDLIAGLIFILFSTAIWFMIPNHIAVEEAGLNAQFFPKLVVIAMFILSLILTISSFFNKEGKVIIVELNKEIKIFIFAMTMILYIFFLDKIGFIISSLLFSTSSIFLLKGKKYYLIVMSILTIIIYVSFRFVLNIQLP